MFGKMQGVKRRLGLILMITFMLDFTSLMFSIGFKSYRGNQ